MHFLRASSLQSLDAATIEDGTPGVELMARACRALAEECLFLFEDRREPLLICAGPGNNGGDGFGLALHLRQAGVPVTVWVAARREQVRGDARVFMEAAESAGVPLCFFSEIGDWLIPGYFSPAYSWIVDALLGTGSREAPRGVLAAAVTCLDQMSERCPLIAVDLPTGLDPDRGKPFDAALCLRADFTLTLAAAKIGFAEDASAAWTGSVTVLDLGFADADLGARAEGSWRTMDLRQAGSWLAPMEVDTHKGRRGHVGILGGSPGMSGAPVLAGRAALRSGAGVVTLFGPMGCQHAAIAFPELMSHSLASGGQGTLLAQEMPSIRCKAWVLGPGMGVDADTADFTRRFLRDVEGPVVLDASALGVLAGLPEFLGASRVLTPHPGEMAALLDCGVAQVQADRIAAVEEALRQSGSTVVLKGSHTRIASPTGGRWVNLNGNPGLATAGSGDVLAGIIATFLAQGLPPETAAALGVFLHGRAGDLASVRKGRAGLCAGDVIEALPAVLRQLQGR